MKPWTNQYHTMALHETSLRRSAHLTNDAIQKTTESYNTYEDHCKLSMAELQVTKG
jgi:hypothetical protein